MAYNKIGFHIGSQPNATGWGDYVRALDAAGIPATCMSMSGEGLGDIIACWDAGSTVQHTAVVRYMSPNGTQDVPPYGTDQKQAAINWWAWQKPLIGSDVRRHKDKIVIKMGNELDKNQAEWLAGFYIELYQLMQSDPDGPFRLGAFGFAAGEPEPVHWRGPRMLDYLRLCASDPAGAAVVLHEYSYADDLESAYPHKIGRFLDLLAACDENDIKRPSIYIHEWGWRQDTLPGVGTAMAHISWAAELYAAWLEVKGAGLWTLQGAGSYGNPHISKLAQPLIAPIKEYSLAARFLDPDPIDSPDGGNMNCNPRVPYARKYLIAPQAVTLARWLEICTEAFAGRNTVAFSYDDAGHAPGVSSNTAVLYDIPADKQADFIAFYKEYYPETAVSFAGGSPLPPEPGNPLDGLLLGSLFEVAYALTSPFNAPRDYSAVGGKANDKHEGADYDVIGTNPNSKEMVLCVYDGVVERSLDSTGGYGKYVRVVHTRNGRQFYTRYCHLDTRVVSVGAIIEQGDPVGEIGTSGNVTGEHVHFNLEVPGFGLSGYVVADVVDPAPYLPIKVEPPPVVVPPPAPGPARIGLHASADPGDLFGGEAEYAEFRTLKPGVIKVLNAHSETAVKRLASENPGCQWVVRAFLDWGGRNVTPQNFFDWTKDDTLRTVNALRGAGVADSAIHVELHNEPNLTQEGWGYSWVDGVGFNAWLLDVLNKYRGFIPTVKYLYPGLSPGGAIAGVRYDSGAFLDQSLTAAKACDGVALHTYWSDGFPVAQAYAYIDAYVAKFGTKPLWITEASRNDRPSTKTPQQYGADYFSFWQELKKRPSVQGVTFYVASASNGYFAPECWVVNKQSRGIAAEIKKLKGV